MNLDFVPADKMVVKEDTWCQTLGQYIGVHFTDLNPNGQFKKKSKRRWVEDIETSGGIDERVCGNSRGQLKKKWNIQECSRQTHCGISIGLAFWPWGYKWCYTILQNIQGCESLFSPELLRVKWQI